MLFNYFFLIMYIVDVRLIKFIFVIMSCKLFVFGIFLQMKLIGWINPVKFTFFIYLFHFTSN